MPVTLRSRSDAQPTAGPSPVEGWVGVRRRPRRGLLGGTPSRPEAAVTDPSTLAAPPTGENPRAEHVEAAVSPVSGDDLARSRGTDFFHVEEHLDARERAVVARVREFSDDVVAPVANEHWENAEFPAGLLPAYAGLGVAGGALDGHGCPGLSPLAEGMVTAEFARGDGSVSTFHGVHSGLAMTTIGMLGSAEQQQRWLPDLAAVRRIGAF